MMHCSSRFPMMPSAAHAESYPMSCQFALFLTFPPPPPTTRHGKELRNDFRCFQRPSSDLGNACIAPCVFSVNRGLHRASCGLRHGQAHLHCSHEDGQARGREGHRRRCAPLAARGNSRRRLHLDGTACISASIAATHPGFSRPSFSHGPRFPGFSGRRAEPLPMRPRPARLCNGCDGVERDCGIIPPQFLVIFGRVVVESFLEAECSQQHMPTHNAGDWALGRAGGGAEALQRRTALRGGTELNGSGIYHPRVATRRGRLGNVRQGKVVKSSRRGLHKSTEWVGDRPRRIGHAKSRRRVASRWRRPCWGSRDRRYERGVASPAWRGRR